MLVSEISIVFNLRNGRFNKRLISWDQKGDWTPGKCVPMPAFPRGFSPFRGPDLGHNWSYMAVPDCTMQLHQPPQREHFRTERRLLTYLRSSVTKERLNYRCLRHIHKETVDNMDLKSIVVPFIFIFEVATVPAGFSIRDIGKAGFSV